ncbi:hypothetical protein M434DRAFT_397492 [Hypoxylon sp. CO27-5]|nr:hypothetical protein M434DRAFT_397492 [Hypoxylon sp. CO27-5]
MMRAPNTDLFAPPEDMTIFEFAQSALQRVHELAIGISVQLKSQDASTLSTNLYLIKDIPLVSTKTGLERSLRVLLFDLERICCWQQSQAGADLTVLTTLVRPETDWLGQQANNTATKGITKFFASPKNVVDSYIIKLRRFIEKFGSKGRSIVKPAPLDEYPGYVNSWIYNVLYSHSLCACDSARILTDLETSHHVARLRLRGKINIHDGNVMFDLLLSSLHGSFEYWQDIELQVITKGRKTVQFQDVTQRPEQRRPTRILELGSFCELLGSRLGCRVCLRLQDSNLHQLFEGKPMLQDVKPGPSISLKQVLKTYRLTNKMKLVLCCIVAKSVWQFYGSRWMDSAWSSDTIHFLLETSGVYACKPYYSVDFDETGGKMDEYCDKYSVVYRYPRLLKLSIILLEIATGCSVEVTTDGETEREMNTNWTLATNLVRAEHYRKRFKYPDFWNAVSNCLDGKKFDQACNNSDLPNLETNHDIEKRRKILYDTVVTPLYRLVEDLGYSGALEEIGPMKPGGTRPTLTSLSAESNNVLSTSYGYLFVSGKDGEDTQKSKEWLDEIKSINAHIHTPHLGMDGIPNPVKVAILDTGFDKDTSFFQMAPRQDQIKGWMDFSDSPSQNPVDECGHGTHTLALAMKVAPAAHFYVARVTQDLETLQYASLAICKAIQWANEECRADIISMSFGFPEDIKDISMAIRKAEIFREERVLFFAAASNSGGNRKELFPARHDSVISIRQTNYQGRFSDNNPAVNPQGPSVYGTLGQNVPSAWLHNVDGEIAKSGSSVATAVAVGITAMMLSFANIGLCTSCFKDPKNIKKLWTRAGILALFERMSGHTEYRSMFISPQKFFSERNAEQCWISMEDACI